MEAINMILSALNIKKSNSEYELTNIDFGNYYNYIIKNDKMIKDKIDKFNEDMNCPLGINDKAINFNLSFQETVETLNYLLSRKEIMNAINESNIIIYKNFKEIIEILFSRIIYVFLENCNSTNDIFEKCMINVNICHYSIFYKNIFNDNLNKTFENYYKSLAYRCFNIATNYGCIVSWMTFAKLCPEMVTDTCYPSINKNTIIYKQIIWENVKKNVLFEKEFELFIKYHINL